MNTVIEHIYNVTGKLDERLGLYLYQHYEQKHRFYHNLGHIDTMWRYIERHAPKEDWPKYADAVLWHDLVYVPGATDNELKSAEAFMAYAAKHPDKLHARPEDTVRLIMATAHPGVELQLDDVSTTIFIKADWNGMMDMRLDEDEHGIDRHWLDQWERGIFLENQRFGIEKYLVNRRKFLVEARDKGLISVSAAAHALCNLRRTYRVGVMVGTFCPFHNGHMQIYEQACEMFDKVVVVAGRNPDKPLGLSDVSAVLPYAECLSYDGQTVDLLHSMVFSHDANGWTVQPVLVRGIRDDLDRAYEDTYVRVLRDQCARRRWPEFPIVHILCKPSYSHVSGKLVRGLQGVDKLMYTPPVYEVPKLDIYW